MVEKSITELPVSELQALLSQLEKEYADFAGRNLKLNMARGKPAPDLLDSNMELLGKLENCTAADGTDARNYGVLEGLPEMREFFADVLKLSADRIIVGGNSSLNMMYDSIARLMLFGTCGNAPWSSCAKRKFLCPAPGYDRHFAVTQEFGFELIPVDMTPAGPDMDAVEALCKSDPDVKGIWCVPLYSNPQGICYSDETVERLAKMETAAADFRIFWDNAYGVHHLGEEVALADIFEACEKYGNPERAYYFFSTSKITFPGAGVAMMASGPQSRKEILAHMGIQTIGSDKLNQLRTLAYLKDAANLRKQMQKLAGLLKPKFDMVSRILNAELGNTGLAQWNDPAGGYFVALDTLDGCAGETLRLAKEAGVTMTGAGATFPCKKDPRDRNIRIAPTYPSCEELQIAMKLFCVCVKIAGIRKILQSK